MASFVAGVSLISSREVCCGYIDILGVPFLLNYIYTIPLVVHPMRSIDSHKANISDPIPAR